MLRPLECIVESTPLAKSIEGGEGVSHPTVPIQSFVIKVWVEETIEEAGRVTWRGHITHVPSGTRRYVDDVNDITSFIRPYLREMGVEAGPLERVSTWLQRKRWSRR